MAKRFTDTNKYKKPFIRSLKGAYKLFWDYLYHDCDHAGIWIVDFDIAQIYLGIDMPVNKEDALKYFNKDEQRIIEFDNGSKWFIPSFIQFQYGELNEKNRAHNSVISILNKYNLLNIKPHISPLQGGKDMDMDKDKDKDKDMELEFSESEEKTIQFICKEFEISEINHPQNYFQVVKCVKNQSIKGDTLWKHFKDQCWNYFLYKKLAKEKLHGLKSFLGTGENKFDDGGWNADNWIKKHLDLKKETEQVESNIYPAEEKKGKVYPGKIREKTEPNLLKVIKENAEKAT